MSSWAEQFWNKWFPDKDPDNVKDVDFEKLQKNPEFAQEVDDFLSKRRQAEFLVRPKKDRSDSISGAQLTLDNLVGNPGYTPKSYSELPYSVEPSPINADGWLGIPDPNKYPPGTVRLTPEQLKEEIQAGNIISLVELQKLPWEQRERWLDQKYPALQRMHEHAEKLKGANNDAQRQDRLSSSQGASTRSAAAKWEQPKEPSLNDKMGLLTFLLTKGDDKPEISSSGFPTPPKALMDPRTAGFVIETWMKNFWIRMMDGTRISLYNLFRFVEDNPELEALAKRNLTDFRTIGQNEEHFEERIKSIPPWELVPNWPKMMLSPDAEARLNFGRVAHRTITTLAPSFFNPDPEPDFSYAVYLHETVAKTVLGDKWGGRPAASVLNDPGFYRDLVEEGPNMGTSLMFVTHRELPYENYKEALCNHVMQHVMKRAPQEENLTRLQLLKSYLDREHLATGTKLLTKDGENIRQGCNILVNTGPDGQVMLQAISPGVLKEKEYYTLGLVRDPMIARGVLESFIGPAVVKEDEDFMKEMGTRSLFFINGFRSRNADDNPHQKLVGQEPDFGVEVLPASTEVFALPPVGYPPFPTLVTYITDAVAHKNMMNAFENAARAAMSVEGTEDRAAKQRVAAEVAFRRSLKKFGMPVDYLLQFMPDGMLAPDFEAMDSPNYVPCVDSFVEPLAVEAKAS